MDDKLLERAGKQAKKLLHEDAIKRSEGTKPIQINGRLYKKIKIASAEQNVPIKKLASKAIQHALDDGTI